VARYNLGRAYQQRGDYSRAEDSFRRALDLEPGYEDGRAALKGVEALRQATGEQGTIGRLEVKDLKALADRLQEQEKWLQAAEQVQAERPAPAPAEAPAQAAPQPAQPRAAKASLVKAVGGGRSMGALPITIDFPTPDTSSYDFVKPFLGKAEATVSFRALSRRTAMLIELALTVCALLGFMAIRAWRRAAGVGFAGGALAVAVALYLASSPSVATLFASTALAMALCLAGEAVCLGVNMIRLNRGEVR
jgi:tetratricopeptide (TPR) repeat protein